MTGKLIKSVNLLCMHYATIRYKDDLSEETLGIARGCSSAQVLPPRDDLSNPAQMRADTLAEGNFTLKEEERNFERVFQRREDTSAGGTRVPNSPRHHTWCQTSSHQH